MSELDRKDSDSDISNNSSWTLLADEATGDDDRSVENQNQQVTDIITPEPEKLETVPKIEKNESTAENLEIISQEAVINPENDVESLSSSSSSSIDTLSEIDAQENISKQGCLTYDEYLTEKELSHDYDYDDRAELWEYLWKDDKKRKRKYKKCKAENLKTMTVVGAVLSLAGISLICMMTPYFSKHFLSSDVQSKIETNFTKIETPYASANNLKVYVDKFDKRVKLTDNVDTLDPYIQKCCKSHMKNVEKEQKISKKEMQNDELQKSERPITYKEFLKEKSVERNEVQEKADINMRTCTKITKNKDSKINKDQKIKVSEHEASKTAKRKSSKQEGVIKNNSEKTENKKKLKQEELLKHEAKTNEANLNEENENKQKCDDRRNRHEFRVKRTLDKNNRYVKNSSSKKIGRKIRKEHEDTEKSNPKLLNKIDINLNGKELHFTKPQKDFENRQMMFKESPKINEPNFVLVKKHVVKDNRSINKDEIKPVEKVNTIPNKKVENVFENNVGKPSKPVQETPGITFEKYINQHSFGADFITCQLLQDLCMLKIVGKMKADAKAKEKKLKRKLERKKQRANKTISEVVEQEDENEHKRITKKRKINVNESECLFKDTKLLKPRSTFNFKPKLVDNHFVIECSPITPNNVIPLSNFDLLKELPFHETRKVKKNEKVIVQRVQQVSFDNVVPSNIVRKPNSNHKFNHSKETVNQKWSKFLEDTRKKNEEKLKILEQMRYENRLKMEALIRERRERLKKDASLGIYNVPLPKYTEVSEKLKQLKKKRTQQGFKIESLTSSDSESEKVSPGVIENKISCELLSALKMGKKVTDTFRDWTLKKAPTLTCLKNYCNSKVSQLSERLTNQCFYQTSINSSFDNMKEELEALKCRKEKHEQLKKFWRAKQEYLDKRIEICELLKKKLSSDNVTEENVSNQNITQGVQILDCIISDVLKSVKNSKSCIDRSCHVETEVKSCSKSVCDISVDDVKQDCQTERKLNDTVSANSTDLYKWLFDRKGTEIRKRDISLWNTPRPGYIERKKEVSKQDPSKGYHERIIKKHN